jgi:hypothetical protein
MIDKIGDVSTGTLRQADLLSRFADTLEALLGNAIAAGETTIVDARRQLVLIADAKEVHNMLEFGAAIDADADADADAASDLIAELIETLDQYALPFTYFGTHDGDGASFGFYPVDVNQAMADDPSELEVRNDLPPDHIAVVNDHGNVTLYAVAYTVVWDCV